MLHRVLALLCATVLTFGFWPSPAFAQQDNEPGRIDIVVTDAATKQPLDLARVLLDGPVITTEFTDQHGRVDFIDVPDGIYQARVVLRGYDSVTSAEFEVIEGKEVTVAVTLSQSTALKVIATVSAKSSVRISTSEITNDSAQRILSNDLAGALGKLSGVSVSTSSDDSDATETISLNGQDASQTALTLNGIPLNAPGTAGNLGAFSTDLFTGASVSFGPQAGGLAGGVNFSTLQPTLSWQSQFGLTAGTNGEYNYSLGESGSDGRLGLAVMSTYRTTPSLLDGMTYLDASGLDYNHESDNDQSGQLLDLRYRLNDDQTLSGMFMDSNSGAGLVCTRIPSIGGIPCGYGPDNSSQFNTKVMSLTDDALLGDTSVQVSAYALDFGYTRNELNRYTNDVLDPTGEASNSQTHGFTLNAMLPAKERHTLSIQAYSANSSQLVTPLVPEAIPYYTGSQGFSYSTVSLNDSIQSSTKLSLNESFGLSAASNSPTAIVASTGANWRPTPANTYSFSYSVTGAGAHGGRAQTLTDPGSLTFNCAGDIVSGTAPGALPGKNSSNDASVGWMHQFGTAAQLTMAAYRQVENGMVFPTQVDGIELADELPSGYLGDVENLYDSPAGCNMPLGTPLSLDQLYFNTPVGGTRRDYEGGSIQGYAEFFNSLVIEPYYDITVATILSNSPLIDNPYSTIISGAQTPGTALHRWGAIVQYKPGNSPLMLVADAQHMGLGNSNYLPSYTEFDAAAELQMPRGELQFLATNITDTYAGIFTSPLDAVPLQTAGGTLIPELARPLSPRSYSVSYAIRFGQAVKSNLSRPALAAPPNGGGGRGGFRGGGGFGGGGFRGGGGAGFRGAFSPIGSTPPSNPLDVNQSQACTADDAKTAHAILDPLKAFVAQIEAAKTPSGYPATIAAPDIPGLGVTYHGLGSTYALTIVVKTPNIRSIFPCLQMHFANANDVKSHNLYQPPQAPLFTMELNFMPAVGLYIAPRPPQSGQETFRLYKLPTTPPKAPFGTIDLPQCTADLKKSATQLLGELQAHFASGAATPDWTITPYTAKAGTWYELMPSDVTTLGALLTCGHISTAAQADLTPLGWSGTPAPALNYTPALGLYLVRNIPPAGGPGGQGAGRSPGGSGQTTSGGAPPG